MAGGSGVAQHVHPQHRLPLGLLGVHEHAVAEDAGVVDQHVERRRRCRSPAAPSPPPRPSRPRRGADATASPAQGDDLVDHLLGRGVGRVAAVLGHAEVVDHDLGALPGELQRMLPADAPAGPGHDHHSSITDALCMNLTLRHVQHKPGTVPPHGSGPGDTGRGGAVDRPAHAVRHHHLRHRRVDGPVADLAVAAEERGFDSFYLPEHTHIPISRRTPPPTGDAGAGRGVQADPSTR